MKHDKCGTPDCCGKCIAIQKKLDRYVQILNNIDGDQDKFLWIMDFGKNSLQFDDQYRVSSFEVPGCQSQTWLVPHYVDDKIYFTSDSAALISKGMVCLLADVFSNSTRSDIASFEQKELSGLNLDNLLTPGRRNEIGRVSCRERV